MPTLGRRAFLVVAALLSPLASLRGVASDLSWRRFSHCRRG